MPADNVEELRLNDSGIEYQENGSSFQGTVPCSPGNAKAWNQSL